MEVEGGTTRVSPLLGSERIRIDELQTGLDAKGHIEASVLLVWPYSSTNSSFSLLLAERDAKLHARSQIKVTFHGYIAQEVAKTQVGIGDEVLLALRHAETVEAGETVSTPGKKLNFLLEYSTGVVLELRKTNDLFATVDATAPVSVPVSEDLGSAANQSRQVNGEISIRKEVVHEPQYTPYQVNGFTANSLPDLVEADGYVAGKGRKRTRFARKSDTWRLVDEDEIDTPDPVQEETPALLHDVSQRDAFLEPSALAGTGKIQPHVAESMRTQDTTTEDITETADELEWQANNHSNINVLGSIGVEDETPPETGIDKQSEESGQMFSLPIPTTEPSPPAPSDQTIARGEADTESFIIPHAHPLQSQDSPPVSTIVRSGGLEVDDGNATAVPTSRSIRGDTSDVEQEGRDADEPEEAVYLNDTGAQDVSHAELQGDATGTPTVTIDDGVTWQQLNEVKDYSPVDLISPLLFQHDEIESEDMYGPAVPVIPQLQKLAQTYAEEPEQTVVTDVLQQFIDLTSPVTESRPEAEFKQNHSMAYTTATNDTSANERIDDSLWSEKLSVTAVETFYDAVYTPPSFQFQPRRRLSRRSSQGSTSTSRRTSNMDGVSDLGRDAVLEERPEGETMPSVPVPEDLVSSPRDGDDALSLQQVIDPALGVNSTSQGRNTSIDGTPEPDLDRETIVMPSEQERPTVTDDSVIMNLDFEPTTEHTHTQQLRSDTPAAEVDLISSIEAAVAASLTEDSSITPLADSDQTQLDVALPKDDDEVITTTYLPTPRQTQEVEQEPHSARIQQVQTTEADMEYFTPRTDKRTLRSSTRLNRGLPATNQGITSPYFTPRLSTNLLQSLSQTEASHPSNGGDLSPSPPAAGTPVETELLQPSVAPVETQDEEDPARDIAAGVFEKPDFPAMNREDSKGVTTDTSYYPALQTLSDHYDREVDVMAIAVSPSPEVQRAEAGPKDYYTLLALTDFTQGNVYEWTMTEVFRPNRKALPQVARGEIVVLRNFKVISQKHKPILLSTNNSSWAIIQADGQIAISGPPVELAKSDLDHVARLYEAWEQNATLIPQPDLSQQMTDVTLAKKSAKKGRQKVNNTAKASEADNAVESIEVQEVAPSQNVLSSPKPAPRRSQRRAQSAVHELGDGTKYTDVSTPQRGHSVVHELRDGQTYVDQDPLEPVFEENDMSPSLSTSVDARSMRRQSTRRGHSVVHELRDGTKYVDSDTPHKGVNVVHELRDGTTYVDDA